MKTPKRQNAKTPKPNAETWKHGNAETSKRRNVETSKRNAETWKRGNAETSKRRNVQTSKRKAASVAIVGGAILLALAIPGTAFAQTSSLSARHRELEVRRGPQAKSRTETEVRGNAVIEQFSWTASKPAAPKTFAVHDLVTIIIREVTQFKALATLDTEKKYDVTSDLEQFIKATAGGVGAADFQRGKPNVDYKYRTKMEGDGGAKRDDRLTARITGRIVDVKPNGMLVIEARAQVAHDEEIHNITLTGTCRKEDVTADNSVLSTQLADKVIKIRTEGALKANTTRGWIPKIVDWIKPF